MRPGTADKEYYLKRFIVNDQPADTPPPLPGARLGDDFPPIGLRVGGDCGPAHQGFRRLGRNDQLPGLLCGGLRSAGAWEQRM